MGWAKRLGTKVLDMLYNAAHMPWCGLFVAHYLAEVGIPTIPLAMSAQAWATW